MTSRAQSQHDQGNCWPDTCQFCRWEMEEESRLGEDDDPSWPAGAFAAAMLDPAESGYAASEGREVLAHTAVGGHDDRHTGTNPQALV